MGTVSHHVRAINYRPAEELLHDVASNGRARAGKAPWSRLNKVTAEPDIPLQFSLLDDLRISTSPRPNVHR